MYSLTRLLVPALALGLTAPVMADRHQGKGMHHGGFFKSLTKEQRTQLLTLRVAHKKTSLLKKINMKKIKVELGLLITSDKPNKAAITKKLDQLLAAKKKYKLAKIDHKIAVRKILTADQRKRFDMHVLRKMMRGKRGCGKHGRYHGKRHGYHGGRHGRDRGMRHGMRHGMH